MSNIFTPRIQTALNSKPVIAYSYFENKDSLIKLKTSEEKIKKD